MGSEKQGIVDRVDVGAKLLQAQAEWILVRRVGLEMRSMILSTNMGPFETLWPLAAKIEVSKEKFAGAEARARYMHHYLGSAVRA